MIPDTLDFQLRYFSGKSIIYLSYIENRLIEIANKAVDVSIEKMKIACLLFVIGVLGPQRSKEDFMVNSMLVRLVEDFDSCNKHPLAQQLIMKYSHH